MPDVAIRGRQDGPRVVLSRFAKAPTVIPERIVNSLDEQFLTDAVLRQGDDAPSGVVMFNESTPLFADDDPAVLDDFGEIPIVSGSVGTPRVVRVVRRAMGLRVSKTMMDRNSVRVVQNRMTQIKNTMIRAWEDAFLSALLANANVQTVATDQPWASATSHLRKDINAARYLIETASRDAAKKERFGFQADTLIISTESKFDFLNSNEVSKVYEGGDLASENLKYTGKLPRKFMGLDVLVSWRLSVYAPSSALVLQRKTVGFVSDERPLEATPMYPEGGGGNGGPREAWRTDVTRASAVGIDQPKAACLITGVNAGQTYPSSGGTITV